MNYVPSCSLVPFLDGWEAFISSLGPSPLCRPYIKSTTWHHHYDFLATLLDPKEWCRSCVDPSTKWAKRPISCTRSKTGAIGEWISPLWRICWPHNLMTGGLKPEYYNCGRFLFVWPSYKWLKMTYSVSHPFYLNQKNNKIYQQAPTIHQFT